MTFIVGVGLTQVDRHYDKGLKDLALEAATKALESTELNREDIDFVLIASSVSYLQTRQLDLASYITSSIGLRRARALSVEAGEASGLASAQVALSLIKSGLAENVLIVGIDKLSDVTSSRAYELLSHLHDVDYEGYYELGFGAVAGILARMYMKRYNVDRLTLAYWSTLMHANAKNNPYAMLKFSIRPEAVLDAPPIAEPLTLLDVPPISDGAAAVVLSAKSRSSLARLVDVESATSFPSVALQEDPLKIESLELAFARLKTKREIEAIDVLEIHDSSSITGILILESLGLANRGEAAKMLAEGYFSNEGPLVNLSGGLKARGHPIGATAVYQLAEVAMQIAGTFPGRKAQDAQRGLVVSLNAHGSSSYIAYLDRGEEQ
ncbi:MAG: thiolase family protein [Acidilobaceae archaeon]